MSRLPAPSSLKRKQSDTKSPSDLLTEHERIIYELIKSKQNMGIWIRDIKRETNLHDNIVNKSVKTLLGKRLIKEVVNVHSKGRKYYMAVEFEPSEEITGGAWYVEGNLDRDFINFLKDQCFRHIKKLQVATTEMVADAIRKSRVLKDNYSTQQIGEIVRALVLDDMVMEVKSTGVDEFASIPAGNVCYKCTNKKRGAGEPNLGIMASIPCGVCPRISLCTPDGIISPLTCEYYNKWLDF